MAEQHTGIKGYVGELIVQKWLEQKYPSSSYTIKYQVKPENVDPKGGPYLDFGVIDKESDEIIFICEVKTQDYLLDDKYSKINKSLKYLWGAIEGSSGKKFGSENDEYGKFQNSGKSEHFKFSKELRVILVLMVPPKRIIQEQYDKYIKNMYLLTDILKNLESNYGRNKLVNDLRNIYLSDVELVFNNIHKPNCSMKHIEDFRKNIK